MPRQQKQDKSPKVHQKHKIENTFHLTQPFELNEKQKEIIECSLNKTTRCIFIDGFWGTSKSWLSVYSALTLLNSRKIDEIIYIRNPIESSTTGKVGFLKGDLSEKMAPYNAVLFDKLSEFLTNSEIEKLKDDGRINCIPLGHVRGRSWNCKAIIVDEASSMSYDDILLLMSRCGEFTRIFFIGDSNHQNDIGVKTGFAKMINIFNDDISKQNGIFCFEMKDINDIVRSGFVRFIMEKTGILNKNDNRMFPN